MRCARSLLLLTMTVAAISLAATEGPGVTQRIRAARATGRMRIDGKLNEAAWANAPVFEGFVQTFPKDDLPASEKTELRVLYDDDTLYVAVTSRDRHPELIQHRLSRRDQIPQSDRIDVLIDSIHDHRTAYRFSVNAGGVQQDSLIFNDTSVTDDWDSVWDAAAADIPDGWVAEFAIPLAILRFPEAPSQTWGFAIARHIGRTNEIDMSVRIPLNAYGYVSRFGHLVGLDGIRPRRDVEVTPYVAARVSDRPQLTDSNGNELPHPRLADPSGDLGADVKIALTTGLTLNATVNPDFGQVEADEVIQNLTNVEAFFPEKRPFFLQGMDLFQQVGSENGTPPQLLFYSRRIGLDSPIFAAAKVSGALAPGLELGLLDAVVGGPSLNPNADPLSPDRTYSFQWTRPLHFAPNDSLPTGPTVPENFFAGVLRYRPTPGLALGLRAGSAIPLTGVCTETDPTVQATLPQCAKTGANVAALDWDWRSRDGEWGFYGQVDGSQTVGGPPVVVLRDGTHVARGDLGEGTYFRFGKVGGEPFRFDVNYGISSPRLYLNALGYLQRQNYQTASVSAHYVRPSGFWQLLNFDAHVQGIIRWTADGTWLKQPRGIYLYLTGQLRGFHSLYLETGLEDNAFDTREIPQAGVGYQRPRDFYVVGQYGSDPSLPLSTTSTAGVGCRFAIGVAPQVCGWTFIEALIFRPHDRLETRLTLTLDYTPHGPRFVTQDPNDPTHDVFGELFTHYSSVVLRQQLVLTPRLTLQLYAQLFTSVGVFDRFFDAHTAGPTLGLGDLQPYDYGLASFYSRPDFHATTLNINVVLRWEYRLGSTLFLVYTHSHGEPPLAPGAVPDQTILPSRLFAGPATDQFLIKWTYWWNP